MICFSYATSLTVGFLVAISFIFGLNYSLGNFLVFGMSWTIIWGIWCYYASKAFYYFPGYFFIICYQLKIQLSAIEKRLKNLMKHSKHFSMRSKISMIRRLLRDHNDLCQRIDEYNQYWRKHLTLTYPLFVFVVCFLSYGVFIAPIELFFRIQSLVILSAHILLLMIITYCASTVSHFNEIIFRDLCSVYVRNRFPNTIKLKVRKN
jgi:hypothetical protein